MLSGVGRKRFGTINRQVRNANHGDGVSIRELQIGNFGIKVSHCRILVSRWENMRLKPVGVKEAIESDNSRTVDIRYLC